MVGLTNKALVTKKPVDGPGAPGIRIRNFGCPHVGKVATNASKTPAPSKVTPQPAQPFATGAALIDELAIMYRADSNEAKMPDRPVMCRF